LGCDVGASRDVLLDHQRIRLINLPHTEWQEASTGWR
jgi:hypothetical protein